MVRSTPKGAPLAKHLPARGPDAGPRPDCPAAFEFDALRRAARRRDTCQRQPARRPARERVGASGPDRAVAPECRRHHRSPPRSPARGNRNPAAAPCRTDPVDRRTHGTRGLWSRRRAGRRAAAPRRRRTRRDRQRTGVVRPVRGVSTPGVLAARPGGERPVRPARHLRAHRAADRCGAAPRKRDRGRGGGASGYRRAGLAGRLRDRAGKRSGRRDAPAGVAVPECLPARGGPEGGVRHAAVEPLRGAAAGTRHRRGGRLLERLGGAHDLLPRLWPDAGGAERQPPAGARDRARAGAGDPAAGLPQGRGDRDAEPPARAPLAGIAGRPHADGLRPHHPGNGRARVAHRRAVLHRRATGDLGVLPRRRARLHARRDGAERRRSPGRHCAVDDPDRGHHAPNPPARGDTPAFPAARGPAQRLRADGTRRRASRS